MQAVFGCHYYAVDGRFVQVVDYLMCRLILKVQDDIRMMGANGRRRAEGSVATLCAIRYARIMQFEGEAMLSIDPNANNPVTTLTLSNYPPVSR